MAAFNNHPILTFIRNVNDLGNKSVVFSTLADSDWVTKRVGLYRLYQRNKIPGDLKKFPVSWWNLVDILAYSTFLSAGISVGEIFSNVGSALFERLRNRADSEKVFLVLFEIWNGSKAFTMCTLWLVFVPELFVKEVGLIQTKVMLKTPTLQMLWSRRLWENKILF